MSFNKRQLSQDTKEATKPRFKAKPFGKDVIFDPMGQWKYPGQVTKIPSGNITMRGVGYPVLGIDDLGNQQMMYPGQNYQYPGSNVTEYPVMQDGGVPTVESPETIPSTEGSQPEVQTANEMPFPELRQVYNYDCGASALQSVLTYYGIDEREDSIIKALGTTTDDIKKNGSNLASLIKVARDHGLDAQRVDNMTPDDLPQYIDQGVPVIILLQAWRDDKSPKEWSDDYKDGHYAIPVAYDQDTIIFEDPSAFTRTSLTKEELAERWHGLDDDNKTKIQGTGIVVNGQPEYQEDTITRMMRRGGPIIGDSPKDVMLLQNGGSAQEIEMEDDQIAYYRSLGYTIEEV